MKIIYRLEEVKCFCYDRYDEEYVEKRTIIGHFTTLEKLRNAISVCINNGVKSSEISISSFFDSFSSNQKYIYILSHQYYLIDGDQYVDYEYIFSPFSNRKKCLKLKEKLLKERKYALSKERCYDLQPPDGFYISKQKLDFLYGMAFCNAEGIKI